MLCVCRLRDMRIARAVLSVSRLYSSRDSTKRTTRSNSTTKKKLKKREKGAHKTYRLWCPLLERTRRRSHSKARKVVRSWCVNGSKCARARLNFVRFEKRLFFKANAFSFETPHVIYACALNATVWWALLESLSTHAKRAGKLYSSLVKRCYSSLLKLVSCGSL